MNRLSADQLYRLLPAIHRLRDGEAGGQLRALIEILAEQARALEEDVERLYDDQFIETCAPWVVAYIGDLIGYEPIHSVAQAVQSGRAEVANTIRYRRRKGTAAVLEELARDVTGWPARAVEYFQRLGWTQNVNHVRPEAIFAPDLRRWAPLARLGTAFEPLQRTVDVGRIPVLEGRHNIQNVGLHLWRLRAYPLRGSPAVPLDPRRWFMSPLRADMPLFTLPETEEEITHLATPFNVPDPIGRRFLDENLEHLYPRSLSLRVDGVEIPAVGVRVCDLSDDGAAWAHAPATRIAIDPVLGRLAFPTSEDPPEQVLVKFHYGFPFEVGGGPYERRASFTAGLAPVTQVRMGDALQPAIDGALAGGAVEIVDSGRYEETISIAVDPDRRLELRAGNEHRPAIVLGGALDITGGAESEVVLNGLLIIGGTVRVPAGTGLRRLIIRHCTLVPGLALETDGTPASPDAPGLMVEAEDVTVEIERSILGAIRTVESTQVSALDAIVDATGPDAGGMDRFAFSAPDGQGPGGWLTLIDATVIGRIHAAAMPLVSNTILDARPGPAGEPPVRSVRKQIGCVRFSYVPSGSLTPRGHRCQPELAAAQAIRDAERRDPSLPEISKQRLRRLVDARVRPVFTTRRYGRPAYLQLVRATDRGIRQGADDEGSMGAYHKLYEPQRESDLRVRLGEYLPFGLESGILFET
jgi:hypothetical protein